ncbi:MAG: hypothetical protein JWQ76_1441 [Ramlibacter sp.]|nr:hypothetical protein [Ramlibacter sp.]
MAGDAFDLQRFVTAQAPVMDAVLAELGAGRKRSHWMWFVFPQLRGLGLSSTAQHYGIASLAEARAYLAHPVLGPRLRACCALVLGVQGRSANEILGSPDDLKLRSCLTLFGLAAPDEPVFGQALQKYYGGVRDPKTVALLSPSPSGRGLG